MPVEKNWDEVPSYLILHVLSRVLGAREGPSLLSTILPQWLSTAAAGWNGSLTEFFWVPFTNVRWTFQTEMFPVETLFALCCASVLWKPVTGVLGYWTSLLPCWYLKEWHHFKRENWLKENTPSSGASSSLGNCIWHSLTLISGQLPPPPLISFRSPLAQIGTFLELGFFWGWGCC